MSAMPEFKIDIARNLGPAIYKDFLGYIGEVQRQVEREGRVVQERRTAFTPAELTDFLLDEYALHAQNVTAGQLPYCKGKSIEEVFLKYGLPRYNAHVIYSVGIIQALADGDFRHLYRALLLYVRYYYASDIYPELMRNRGFAYGTGIDHSAYQHAVMVCFAIMRPDYAKRFYPKDLGLIKRSHATLKRLGSLIIALLHDDGQWKAQALKDARKYLEGKRQISERAVISYMINLYEGNAAGMSDDLQTLMDNYRKAGWLIEGEGCRISLYGYYLMAKWYLPPEVFKQVRRPNGPGWWDAYIDLCLQNPLPSELDEPYIIFPKPLAFLNKAIGAIDLDPPPGSVVLSLDIKREYS